MAEFFTTLFFWLFMLCYLGMGVGTIMTIVDERGPESTESNWLSRLNDAGGILSVVGTVVTLVGVGIMVLTWPGIIMVMSMRDVNAGKNK